MVAVEFVVMWIVIFLLGIFLIPKIWEKYFGRKQVDVQDVKQIYDEVVDDLSKKIHTIETKKEELKEEEKRIKSFVRDVVGKGKDKNVGG